MFREAGASATKIFVRFLSPLPHFAEEIPMEGLVFACSSSLQNAQLLLVRKDVQENYYSVENYYSIIMQTLISRKIFSPFT